MKKGLTAAQGHGGYWSIDGEQLHCFTCFSWVLVSSVSVFFLLLLLLLVFLIIIFICLIIKLFLSEQTSFISFSFLILLPITLGWRGKGSELCSVWYIYNSTGAVLTKYNIKNYLVLDIFMPLFSKDMN